MIIASLVYNKLIQTYKTPSKGTKITQKILKRLRKLLIKMGDPECEINIYGRQFFLPISHNLPLFLEKFPHYDKLLSRLSEYLRIKYGYLNFVDIGANIGDTIARCYKDKNDTILAVEANPHFTDYLEKNCRQIQNFKLLKIYCDSHDGISKIKVNEKGGTATIREQESGDSIERKSIDTIIDENPLHNEFNLLKIDTDGHDFKVIKGAEKYISKNLPSILFECDVCNNDTYVEDFIEVMGLLNNAGYTKAIVYDNYGYLFSVFDLNKLQHFKYLLLYQLTSDFYYYDILVMKDEDIENFLSSELSYFVEKTRDKSLRKIARVAAEL